jgi:outer membrane lipoprotein-sorting protein
MKKILTAFLLLLLFTVGSRAQTADEVISKHIEAMGGAEKLKSLKSLYLEGVAVMQNGNEVISKIYKVQDKLLRREIEFGMGSVTVIVTDKEGWSSNPRSGGAFQPLPKEAVDAQQIELDIAGPFVDYAAKGHKVELVGKENIGDKETYKLKLTPKTGREINYFIDAKDYYIIRQNFKGGGMFGGQGRGTQGGSAPPADTEINVNYSDYRKTPEGYVFAYTVSMGNSGNNMTYEKIEVNKPVDEKLYKPNK